jgi:hypothetical protein
MDEDGTEVASCDGKVNVHQGTGTITWSDGSTEQSCPGVTEASLTGTFTVN